MPFALFPHYLTISLRVGTEISHEAFLRLYSSYQWRWCLWHAWFMHNICDFFTFFIFSLNILNQSVLNFTWAFFIIMRCWICKMVFSARMIIISHKLCIINAFIEFFVQKFSTHIFFVTKNFTHFFVTFTQIFCCLKRIDR